jgi:hypothetical protein
MELNRQSPAAAPPDDGGHQGSYTTPDQTMEMHAAERAPQAPALHRDLDRHTNSDAGSVRPMWMLGAAVLLIVIAAFFFVR